MSRGTTYRFGPLERRGLLGQLSLAQVVLFGLGTAVAIVVLNRYPSGAGMLVAAVTLLAAVAAGRVRIGGCALHEWTLLLLRSIARRGGARHRVLAAPLPQAGPAIRRRSAPWRELRRLELGAAMLRGRPLGYLAEPRTHRANVVLACRAGGFALLDREVQERRLRAWGSLLAGAADGPLRRLQWVERTLPAQGDELATWLGEQRDPTIPLRGNAMVESYLELISGGARVASEHEILLVLQVDLSRTGRGGPTAEALVVEQVETLARALEAAEVDVLGALSPGQLTRMLRVAFDPFARGELTALELADPARAPLPLAEAWPLATEEAWDHLRCDGSLHVTYWISGWPRVDVTPMFMEPLLGRSSAVRTVSLCLEPLPPARALREVEAAITQDRADRALRARLGQTETERQRQAHEAAVRREQELAVGHGEVRFCGYVTVTGREEAELRRACAEVLEHAARARLELRRLYGRQREAFTFTLPLGRGLR